MALERPRAEGREGAERAGRGEAVGVAVHGGAHQHAERERSEEVDGERAVGELAPEAAGDRAVQGEARDRSEPPDGADPQDDRKGHPAIRARRTRLVATATAAKPAATLASA